MRFRAEIVDQTYLCHFKRVINMLYNLAKTCTLYICPEKLNFIVSEKQAIVGGFSCFYEFQQDRFFNRFEIEGVSGENNEIYLELGLEKFCGALNAVKNVQTLTIKLTNKHPGSLMVCIELLSVSGRIRIVTHYFPIKFIPRNLWKNL
ncbi:checkpoint protein HUS1-like [Thomomys bottae]